MLFRTGPGFQAPTGIAEIEVRQGIRRVLLQAGFKGCARLLVLVVVSGNRSPVANFLAPFITGCRGHRQVSTEPEQRDEYEYKDRFHNTPLLIRQKRRSVLSSHRMGKTSP